MAAVKPGPVEKSVRAACRGRSSEPLVQVAYALARRLDHGPDMAAAAVAKELRVTLDALSVGEQEGSALDDLAARRAARFADAAGQSGPAG